MKPVVRNKGDPSRSARSARFVMAAAAVAGLLQILGVTQASSARSVTRGFESVSGIGHPPGWARGRAIHFDPGASEALARRRERRGFGGRRCETKENYCPTPPLLYKGGAGIQEKPTLYLILWGSNWNTGIGSKLASRLKNLYLGISGSSYQGILTQYFATKGRIGTKVTLTSFVDTSVTAPTGVNDTKIQEEVNSAISANSWTREFNAQFIVATPPGTTYVANFNAQGFCGYHAVTKVGVAGSSYSFVPYAGEEPFSGSCLSFDALSKAENVTTMFASHEYAESATDPDLKSPTWATSDRSPFYEIADICGKEDDEIAGGLWVQDLWDNFKGDCVLEDASPAWVYSVTEAASGLTGTAATLNGTVNPESQSTEYLFEYGLTTKYGSKTSMISAGSGSANTKVKAALTGLAPATIFHFRLVAKNAKGTGNGLDIATKTL